MSEQLQIIYQKLQELIKKHQLTQKELQKVQQENIQLKAAITLQKNTAQELSKESNNIPIHTSNLSLDEKKRLEKRINGYLSEIEKCLSLLNT